MKSINRRNFVKKSIFDNNSHLVKLNRNCLYNVELSSFSQNENRSENIANKLFTNKYSIVFAFSSIGFLSAGYVPLSFIAAGVSFYYYVKSNELLRVKYHNFIDDTFTKTHNNKILYSLE